MQKIDADVRNAVIEYVAESFVNILETLFILRRWSNCPDENSIEKVISAYLQGRDDSFWKRFIKDYTNGENIKPLSDIATDIVRHVTSIVDLRKRSKNEIAAMFNSLEKFEGFMKKSSSEVKLNEKGSRRRGLKTAKATVFAREVKGSPAPVSLGGGRKNDGGLSKIGPPTRLYSSSLSRERIRDRLLYWSEHKDDLYSG